MKTSEIKEILARFEAVEPEVWRARVLLRQKQNRTKEQEALLARLEKATDFCHPSPNDTLFAELKEALKRIADAKSIPK